MICQSGAAKFLLSSVKGGRPSLAAHIFSPPPSAMIAVVALNFRDFPQRNALLLAAVTTKAPSSRISQTEN
jgi:hypothetical protein